MICYLLHVRDFPVCDLLPSTLLPKAFIPSLSALVPKASISSLSALVSKASTSSFSTSVPKAYANSHESAFAFNPFPKAYADSHESVFANSLTLIVTIPTSKITRFTTQSETYSRSCAPSFHKLMITNRRLNCFRSIHYL